ncbi:MAG: hypothetical protein LUE93_00520 [Bacteroides sp.]|nr:hypothetical protein [Bacteroides sp.]
MSIFSKLFKKKSSQEGELKGSVEEFMSLIRVYYQSVMAVNLGITNINFIPDVAMFKRVFKVPTQNGKLGLAEKSRSRKILIEEYGFKDEFFKEIDTSVKKNCKTQNDIRSYLFMFQGFSNDLLMLTGNLMKWKFGISRLFKKVLYQLTQKTIHDIMTRSDWKADDVRKTATDVRKYQKALGYSEQWMTDYIYHIVLLAKDEKKKKPEESK